VCKEGEGEVVREEECVSENNACSVSFQFFIHLRSSSTISRKRKEEEGEGKALKFDHEGK